ncbi:M4 family metallopeptidase [Ramlibacter sp. PS4R-6]|uniref:M4 family metallopeptidase n=1 Tax=Ramlibacter sp. PS4R-6 TaxID=3133438 RepID=UPI00309C3629
MSARLRCVCCALPRRALEHVGLGHHHAATERLRSERHAHTVDLRAAAANGKRERFVFDAAGTEALPGTLVRPEGARAVGDAAANQAYENVGITLDFYAKVFGRDSLDGAGMDVSASVHWGEGFANAMWTGKQMLFGDGDGVRVRGFTHCLDIVAHELTHAVTQHAVRGGLGIVKRKGKLDLAGEAGALNESISDVFASLVKQWHRKQDVKQADWLVGEGVFAPEIGRAVRSLKQPGDDRLTYGGDDQAGDMRGFVPGGDVHANSGIPNRAFYLAATALGGRAWEHAGRIWYDSVPRLKPKATFVDAAHVTSETAARLFGIASREQHAVQAAWQKVGVLPA